MEFNLPECITKVTGQKSTIFGRLIFNTLDGYSLAVFICQELWSRPDMCEYLLKNQCDFIFSGNGSCYYAQKINTRKKLLNRITKSRGGLIYSNVKGKLPATLTTKG